MGLSFVLQVGYLVIMEAPKCHCKNSFITSFEPPRDMFCVPWQYFFPSVPCKTRLGSNSTSEAALHRQCLLAR